MFTLSELRSWRGQADYSLDQAAALCATVPPTYGFPRPAQSTEAERRKQAEVTGWKQRLQTAAPDLGVTVTPHPPKFEQSRGFVTGEVSMRETRSAWKEYGRVSHQTLVAWLEGQPGPMPEFFASDEASYANALRVVYGLKKLLLKEPSGFKTQDALFSKAEDEWKACGLGQRTVAGVFAQANAQMQASKKGK